MTNIELIAKIKSEIERQEKQCPLDTYEGRHKLFILGELKTFLSTLEKEDKHRLDMEHEIELQIMPSGNVAVYRGNRFIPTEQLTEEERLFVLDKVTKELGGEYKTINKIFALDFINFLDKNRREGKMCLSNGECEDIEKAVREDDWEKLDRYIRKYIGPEEND